MRIKFSHAFSKALKEKKYSIAALKALRHPKASSSAICEATCNARLRAGFRRFALFESGVDRFGGADLVVRALGPSLDREVCRIDARNATLAHHDLPENIAVYGDGSAEEPILSFV